MEESFPSSAERFVWGMSLLKACSMRFRWNEENKNRDNFLSELLKENKNPDGSEKEICAVELIHSKKVISVKNAGDCKNLRCDGIVTDNPSLIPVVTVADCMPVFICEPKTKVFGVLHSGWKGTGIIKEALDLCRKTYGTKNEDFFVVLGPHIRNCCYNVDKERAEYFKNNFTPDCISEIQNPVDKNFPYALSMEKANLAVLKECGVPSSHITLNGECTSCTKLNDGFKYGSNRRETALLPAGLSAEEKSRLFTVQCAFVIRK
ncbi:MAG: polyphenol oxidase family protein [Treponema sp.]|nr:polyphenol oxidase family protein [Treponema sp.]